MTTLFGCRVGRKLTLTLRCSHQILHLWFWQHIEIITRFWKYCWIEVLQFLCHTISSKTVRVLDVFLLRACRCGCDECIKESEADYLRHSLSRLNEYKALASPSLIALSSSDPILTAFQLSWELRNLAFAEPVSCVKSFTKLNAKVF